jgi:hypothetical protein
LETRARPIKARAQMLQSPIVKPIERFTLTSFKYSA